MRGTKLGRKRRQTYLEQDRKEEDKGKKHQWGDTGRSVDDKGVGINDLLPHHCWQRQSKISLIVVG